MLDYHSMKKWGDFSRNISYVKREIKIYQLINKKCNFSKNLKEFKMRDIFS